MSTSEDLAKLRTHLANERTLLAYVRTGLALGAGGGTLMAFFESARAQWGGFGLLVMGCLTFAVGVWRFRQARGQMSSL